MILNACQRKASALYVIITLGECTDIKMNFQIIK